MRIENLENQRVKASAKSITCKDSNGKTVGIVTRAERFDSLRPNQQSEYYGKLRYIGIVALGELDRIYLHGGKLYYLFDMRRMENYRKYFLGEGFEKEKEKYDNLNVAAELFTQFGTVINCYIQ